MKNKESKMDKASSAHIYWGKVGEGVAKRKNQPIRRRYFLQRKENAWQLK